MFAAVAPANGFMASVSRFLTSKLRLKVNEAKSAVARPELARPCTGNNTSRKTSTSVALWGPAILCGINGVYAFHYAANPIHEDELLRSRNAMAARGPDGAGLWVSSDRRVGFGHRRLSIIDLSEAGAQPMWSSDGRFLVTFNGEIYNYKALRRELEARGHLFRSHSDTEVLLQLYAAKGPEMVRDLRGMFAFAIWDAERRNLVLARDPYGIKPLFYADDGWTFRFASQVKALVAGGVVSREPDPAGQVGFYLFGSVPEPFTLFRAIRALPAGSTVLVDKLGAHEPQRYHSIAKVYRDAEHRNGSRRSDTDVEFRAALLDSVRNHLVADVPVGAFLSSGVDSSALVGLMRDAGQQDIQTVTLSFEEFRGRPEDEAPLAAEVARVYGARHTIRIVSESEFKDDLPRIFEAMDQPSIDGINTWFVAKAARELGLKVAISGLGGDELFGGYPSFRDLPRWARRFGIVTSMPLVGRFARMAALPIATTLGVNPKAAGLLEYGGRYAGGYLLRRGLFMPWELGRLLERDVVEQGLRRLAPLFLIERELTPTPLAPAARVSSLESGLYMRNQLLRDTDWASMAHSLEVRTPLVDSTLLADAAVIAASTGTSPTKSLLAEAPSLPLPEAVKARAKTGFTTPIPAWQQRGAFGNHRSGQSSKHAANTPWARAWAELVMVWSGEGRQAA
jgi:asparagine synthase (glutamine-hydrolysing)